MLGIRSGSNSMDKFIKPRKVDTKHGKADSDVTPTSQTSPSTLRERKALERAVSVAEADEAMNRHVGNKTKK